MVILEDKRDVDTFVKKSGRENLRSDVVLRILRSMSRCTSSGDPYGLGGTPERALSISSEGQISSFCHVLGILHRYLRPRVPHIGPARHSGIGLIFREGLDPELSLCIGFQMIGP